MRVNYSHRYPAFDFQPDKQTIKILVCRLSEMSLTQYLDCTACTEPTEGPLTFERET